LATDGGKKNRRLNMKLPQATPENRFSFDQVF
jgi:hypothetical protein